MGDPEVPQEYGTMFEPWSVYFARFEAHNVSSPFPYHARCFLEPKIDQDMQCATMYAQSTWTSYDSRILERCCRPICKMGEVDTICGNVKEVVIDIVDGLLAS